MAATADSAILYDRPYLWLVALRFALCFYQTGYVHPDEFMQTMEPVAESMLHVNATIPWEFTSRLPLRSWASLILTAAVPAAIAPLRWQLVAARLWMCSLSLLVDVSVAGCAGLLGICRRRCLLTVASSYIMLVLSTRPFSNSLELVLSALLHWLVIHDVTASSSASVKLQRLRKRLQSLSGSGGGYTAHRLRVAEARAEVRSAALQHCTSCGVLVTVGVFVRPTFVLFASVPLLYWLFRGASCSSSECSGAPACLSRNAAVNDPVFSDDVVKARLVRFLGSSVLTGVILTLVDSVLYGWLTIDELTSLNMGWHNIVLTPFNFAVYNLKAHNLAVHGVHWRGTHLFVNSPLLFSSLWLLAAGAVTARAGRLLRHLINLDCHVSSVGVFLAGSATVPLLTLSLAIHQEARFLLPLLVPLSLLFCERLFGGAAGGRWKRTRSLLLLLWWLANISACVFYGFVHQGGVTRALFFLRDTSSSSVQSNGRAVVFWRTYTPPQSLLLTPIPPSVDDMAFHDMAGLPVEQVSHLVSRLTAQSTLTYVVLPASVKTEFLTHLPKSVRRTATDVRQFWPHVSVEALPQFSGLIERCAGRSISTGMCCVGFEAVSQMSLVVIQLHDTVR